MLYLDINTFIKGHCFSYHALYGLSNKEDPVITSHMILSFKPLNFRIGSSDPGASLPPEIPLLQPPWPL